MQDERVQLSNKTMKKYGLVAGFDLEPYSKEFKAALATNNQHPKKVIFERACNAGYKKALENGQYEVMDFFQRLYDHGNYNVKGFKQEFIRKLPLT